MWCETLDMCMHFLSFHLVQMPCKIVSAVTADDSCQVLTLQMELQQLCFHLFHSVSFDFALFLGIKGHYVMSFLSCPAIQFHMHNSSACLPSAEAIPSSGPYVTQFPLIMIPLHFSFLKFMHVGMCT